MNKTLLTMVTNVQNEVLDTSTAISPIIKQYINNRYRQVLRDINWENIRTDYTITTTGGTQSYSLPDDFKKAISVWDTTNKRLLPQLDYQKMVEKEFSTLSSQGSLDGYSILDDRVQAQPTAASVITVVSTSASDTTQTVLIRGISGGSETYETVSLNGLVDQNTSNQYTRIFSVSKSDVTAGIVTAKSNSGAVTIVTISPVITTPFYKKIFFHYVPADSYVVSIVYQTSVSPLVSDYDYPIIDISDIIELGAKADTWRYKKQFDKASVFEAQYASGVADLVWDRENQPNVVNMFNPTTYDRDNLY